jgi:hypothetical protein
MTSCNHVISSFRLYISSTRCNLFPSVPLSAAGCPIVCLRLHAMPFPTSPRIRTDSECAALQTRLEADRKNVAIHCPKTIHGQRCTEPAAPRSHDQSADIPELPQEFIPTTRPRIQDFPCRSVLEILLQEPIRADVDRWSQVYKATVTSQSAIEHPVAVKLFQESKFPMPTLDQFPDEEYTPYRHGWLFGTEMAQRETWAYETLRDVQGSTVPHFYGAYQVSRHLTHST